MMGREPGCNKMSTCTLAFLLIAFGHGILEPYADGLDCGPIVCTLVPTFTTYLLGPIDLNGIC